MSDEDIVTTLAYIKSPMFSKRTTFQEELQEALLARAIKQQTEEYSEDFESDAFSEEEFPESEENICPKSAVFKVSSSKFNLCNKNTLKSESADDLSSLEEYEGSQYVSILERKILSKEGQTIPLSLTEHPGSCKRSAAKQSIPFEISVSNHYSFGKEISENKHLIKDTKDDIIIEERSGCEEDYNNIEETIRYKLILEEKNMIQCKMESKPVPEPREFKTKAVSASDNEHKEIDNFHDLRLLENDRKSPSVIELMMTTVYENTKKQYKPTEDFLEQKLQMLKPSEDDSIETPKDDPSEQKVALTTSKSVMDSSKDFVKEECEEVEAAPQKAKIRSLSTTYLKKTGKYSPVTRSTSAQYLGTLKFLDNKHLQKYSADLDKADSLRAAVYQDWLEKKRIFLLELQRIKRNKAENLQEKNEKKEAAKREEALASFEAWKAMKEKEEEKLAEKKKLEAVKKKKEAELNEKKKEEAQKAFEKWKKKKAAYLKQQIQKEKRIERLKKKEQELVAEKRRDSRSAVEKWNENKEEFMKQKKKEKIQEKKKEVEKQVEKEEQDKRALDEYKKWLEKKEMDESMQKNQKKLQVILEDETPSPWSPPGKAVSSRRY